MTDDIVTRLAILWTIILLAPPILFGLVVVVKFIWDFTVATIKDSDYD
jgi:hypothetical protein